LYLLGGPDHPAELEREQSSNRTILPHFTQHRDQQERLLNFFGAALGKQMTPIGTP
jgi:predicted nuclease of restriction endonuclease-like RecB superfamily